MERWTIYIYIYIFTHIYILFFLDIYIYKYYTYIYKHISVEIWKNMYRMFSGCSVLHISTLISSRNKRCQHKSRKIIPPSKKTLGFYYWQNADKYWIILVLMFDQNGSNGWYRPMELTITGSYGPEPYPIGAFSGFIHNRIEPYGHTLQNWSISGFPK